MTKVGAADQSKSSALGTAKNIWLPGRLSFWDAAWDWTAVTLALPRARVTGGCCMTVGLGGRGNLTLQTAVGFATPRSVAPSRESCEDRTPTSP